MTEEAGAVTADRRRAADRPTPDGRAIEALVRYAGARDLYAVSGSPVRAVSKGLDEEEHRAAHERILGLLTTPGRADEGGNELPTDLRG